MLIAQNRKCEILAFVVYERSRPSFWLATASGLLLLANLPLFAPITKFPHCLQKLPSQTIWGQKRIFLEESLPFPADWLLWTDENLFLGWFDVHKSKIRQFILFREIGKAISQYISKILFPTHVFSHHDIVLAYQQLGSAVECFCLTGLISLWALFFCHDNCLTFKIKPVLYEDY